MNATERTPRPAPCPMTALLPALTEVPTRQVRERRAGDAARHAMVRWSGESAGHTAVPGDQ